MPDVRTRVMISRPIIQAARDVADEIMRNDPGAAQCWLDLCTTSTASRNVGGMIDLQTDWDWVVGFLVFHAGHAFRLPVERG